MTFALYVLVISKLLCESKGQDTGKVMGKSNVSCWFFDSRGKWCEVIHSQA